MADNQFNSYGHIFGRATIAATTGDATIWTATANEIEMLGAVTISIRGAADTCVVALEDGVGGDRLWEVVDSSDGRIDGSYSLFFGGYELTANTLLNLTVETAAATVYVIGQGWRKKVLT